MNQDTESYAFKQFAAKFDYRGQIGNLYGLMITRDNLLKQASEYDERIAMLRSQLPQEIITLFEKELVAERLTK